MDAVDVIVFVAEATICTMFKKVFFFPFWERKKKLLKNLFRKERTVIFKSWYLFHFTLLIKSHSSKNVKSKSINFLINPFIYSSGIAFCCFFWPLVFQFYSLTSSSIFKHAPHSSTLLIRKYNSHFRIVTLMLYSHI